ALVKCRELLQTEANRAGDVRGSCVVRNLVDPRAQRAPPVVEFEAPPDGEVDVLGQVAALLLVGLIGARQTLEGRAESIDGVLVTGVTCRERPRLAVASGHSSG